MHTKGERPATAAALVLVTAALIALVPESVRGGGLEVADLGTAAAGRGTAFVAKADNLSAFHYNPAGLAKDAGDTDALGVLVSINTFRLDLDFTRRGRGGLTTVGGEQVRIPAIDPDTGERYVTVSPSPAGSLGPTPLLVLSRSRAFGIDGLAVAVGALPPSTVLGRGYPDDGPQRYALGRVSGLVVYCGAAAAYRVSSRLQVGVALLNATVKLHTELPVRPIAQPRNDVEQNENRYEDHTFTLSVSDYFAPTAAVGVLGRPVDWLEVGLSARLPVAVEGRGRLGYRPPENPAFRHSFLACGQDAGTPDCVGEGRLSLRQRFPLVLRAGARYVGSRFDIEADVVWEGWRQASAIIMEPDAVFVLVDGSGARSYETLPTTRIDRRLRDTLGLRLGGDLELIPGRLTARAGASCSSSAYRNGASTFSLDLPFATQLGLGGGLTWRPNATWALSAAYMHVFQPRTVVTDGIIQQRTSTEPNLGNVVNNGIYEVALDLFGVAAEARF